MLNKRISTITLSFLLAFSPMYSPFYGSTALASENNETTLVESALGETENDEPLMPVDKKDEGTEYSCAESGHNWDNGKTASEMTCTEERQILFTCTECGETRYEIVAPDGHKFGDWTVVTQPTTLVDGKRERVCSVCGETESEVVAHTILTVETITISRSSVTLLNGKALQLWAKAAPSDATSTAVTWKSSDTNVATVSASGLVSAKRRGTATITCTAKDAGGAKASCVITVKLGVSKIVLNRTSVALNKGKTFTLKAVVSPSAASNKAVTWKSNNTKVATVNSAGVVSFKAKGTATITCTAKDGSGVKASCKVTVRIPVSVINLDKKSATLTRGQTLTLKAGVGPASANNKTVSWKSSNTSVATISTTGTDPSTVKVTAKGKGTATITCSAKDGSGVKAICTITVKAPAAAKTSSSGSSGSGGSGSVSESSVSGSGGSSGYVWLPASGSKYHNKNNCGTMNPSKARKVTTEEAQSRGYEPCKKCFP